MHFSKVGISTGMTNFDDLSRRYGAHFLRCKSFEFNVKHWNSMEKTLNLIENYQIWWKNIKFEFSIQFQDFNSFLKIQTQKGQFPKKNNASNIHAHTKQCCNYIVVNSKVAIKKNQNVLLCAWNREDHAHYTVVAIEFQNTNHILEQNALKFQEKFINANNIWCCSCALYFSFREYILKILYFNFACMFNYMAVFISCTFCTLWFDVLGLCPSILFALKVFLFVHFFSNENEKNSPLQTEEMEFYAKKKWTVYVQQ